MLKKSLKISLAAILCTTFACAKAVKEPYLLSSSPEIRNLEREDHKFCNSLDLNSGSTNKSFSSDLYWHCRLSMAKFKLQTHVKTENSLTFNMLITDLITKISLHLSDAHESVFIKENRKIDARQHAQCLAMGYNFDMTDLVKSDQYLLCRKRLIDDEQLDPPYGNDVYLKYPNRAYNLSFVLDSRLDTETKRYRELEKYYPTCLKYFNQKENLEDCVSAQESSRQCLKNVIPKKFKKESEQKTICQKQAYERFPDSFLREGDQKQKDIQRAKTNADYYNSNSFIALGIGKDDMEFFESEGGASKEFYEREKQKLLERNINSKKGLYGKYGLTKLRQKYILSCQQFADSIVNEYVDDLTKECSEMGDFKSKENLI